MTRRWMVLAPRIAHVGLPILGILGAFVLWQNLSGNLYPVVDGAYYRSGQLTPDRLEQVVRDHGIRSILNLRGVQPDEPWYRSEVALARRLNLARYDVHLSARRKVAPDTLDAILTLLRQAPKPILIHCHGGADRTGLIAALVRLEQGDPPGRARRQLGLRYGHFPWLGSATVAMDLSLETYLAARGRLPRALAPFLTASSP